MTVEIIVKDRVRSWQTAKSRESVLFGTTIRILQNPQGLIAVVGLLLLIAGAVFAGPISGYSPIASTTANPLAAPSLAHPFGTDELQRDLLARTLYGLRTSLEVSVLSVLAGALVGSSIGFLSGYASGWIDAVVMRCVDALLAFPGLLTALAILTMLGPSTRNIGIAIVIFTVPAFARLARAQMLTEVNKDYVVASRAVGVGPGRIIFRHIAVNAVSPLITQTALAMAGAVLIAASLTYLGLGQPPPAPSLGSLLNSGRTYLQQAWWYVAFPSVVLAFMILCLNFLADAINEASSPYAGGR